MNRRKLTAISAALLLCATAAFARKTPGENPPCPQIINIQSRQCTSLDGKWKYVVDPYDTGYYNYRLVPNAVGETFFADKSFDDDKTKLIEYNFDRNQALDVPGDWNTQVEKLYYYEGKLWYRTKFTAAPEKGKRYFLYFGAVNYEAVVGLNGKKIFCRGVSIHEEAPFSNGRIVSEDQDRILLDWAKELGCNFIRLAHYPHNEQMVRLAEEMGFLVWSEIPAYWTISWTNPETYANAEQQLTDMIVRDINRANVVVWSVANETPLSDERLAFLSRLIDKARELDPTRLVSAAMEKEKIEDGLWTVADPLISKVDLISFNQYMGWYTGTSDICASVRWVFPEEKPVFISEFGAGALYGLHGDKSERFTEEYMADCYRQNIEMMSERMPGFSGATPWVLKDFRSPRRALAGIQDDFNRKGLVSEKGQKKSAFYIVQEWYESLKTKFGK